MDADKAREVLTAREYLLIKRGLYYGPDNRGYTGIKDHAGRYTQAEGEALLDCDVTYMHEHDAPMFSQACWDDVKVRFLLGQISALQTKAATARTDALREAAEVADGLVKLAEGLQRKDPLPFDTNEAWRRVADAGSDIRDEILSLIKEPSQ